MSVNRELVTALEKRQAEIKRDCLHFLGELEHRGLRKDQRLDDVSQRRFDRFRQESRACADRIAELREDDDRGLENSPYANLGRGGLRRGCLNPASRLSPLHFADQQLRDLHTRVQRQEPAYAKPERRDFESASGLMPAQLFSPPTFPIHEKRLLDYLPGFKLDSPSLEYIQVNSVTGAATIVAEGALKPEIVMNTTRVITAAQKIAAHTGISWESIQDWDAFTTSVNVELTRQVVDCENFELLNGPGTSGHLTGILSTSGILTHHVGGSGTTPNGETSLDAVEASVAQLRVGPSLAEPTVFVVNPTTWSAMRRTKDSQQRYLVQPDPTADEAEMLWGIPVMATTTCPVGTGVLIDTNRMGRVAVREPIGVRIGYANDDYVKNIVRYVAEERLALCIERPSAILALTGLPNS